MAQFNEAGMTILKGSESCLLSVYQDSKGVWTIGWGHTAGIDENTPDCTQEQADAWLKEDIQNAIDTVNNFLDVDLNDNQFSATVSLVYNEGNKPLKGHFGTYLNDADFVGASNEFCKWVYCGGKILDGLMTRRGAERNLFVQPV